MQALASFVCGRWMPGTGTAQLLLNPATEEALATASSEGIDLAAALDRPGRAGGGGEELGGRRALSFYLQRVALEGSRPVIATLTKGSSAA